MKLKEVIEKLNLFERERVPTEIRIIATYIQNFFNKENCKNSFRILSCFSHSSGRGEEV